MSKQKMQHHNSKEISYYHLRNNGTMVWTRPGFKPTQKKNQNCVKKVWEIDHSNTSTLTAALIEGITLGANLEHIDNITNKNLTALKNSYFDFARENNIKLLKKGNDTWSAYWTEDTASKIINIGFGKNPIYAIASLLKKYIQ